VSEFPLYPLEQQVVADVDAACKAAEQFIMRHGGSGTGAKAASLLRVLLDEIYRLQRREKG